ncbi:hypothetical protein Ahy_A01g001365 [Arachis hypogaea]|uniref:CCHC-type domain-containing protein n=1 Tax=Arachis hypogaea TaxID=3818 RepID=A0A445EMY8_ARAHY|nr:hypothetical protein Ahy_A01g001365 [Arachis hypogaea]
MVKGPDFIYESDSEDEEENMQEEEDSEVESEFEYSDREEEVLGSEEWKARRELPKRKIVWDEEGCPNLILNRAEQHRLNKMWEHTLIIKLLGRRIGYGVLKKRLESMWIKEGMLTLIDVGNEFFLVRFTELEDYNWALKGGPWLIFDHYLAVQRWRPDFNPSVEQLTKIAAWVRIPDLPIEYYDKYVMRTIGNVIGKTLKIDYNTAGQARGKFARICVELDLAKPLRPKFKIKGRPVHVEYEGLHTICFHCGCIGHNKEQCQYAIKRQNELQNSSEKAEQSKGETMAKEQSSQGPYGEWMTVQKPRRGKRVIPQKEGKNHAAQHNVGFRFNALAEGKSHAQVEEEGAANQTVTEEGSGIQEEGSKRIFLSGSQMRKEKGKMVVVCSDTPNSQETVSRVPETPPHLCMGTRRNVSPARQSSAQPTSRENLPIISKGPTAQEDKINNELCTKGCKNDLMLGEGWEEPKPPDIAMQPIGQEQASPNDTGQAMDEQKGDARPDDGMWVDSPTGGDAMQA